MAVGVAALDDERAASDRGELDKIIERSTAAAPSPAAAPPSQNYAQPSGPHGAHGGYYHGKRKKHWLHEFFD